MILSGKTKENILKAAALIQKGDVVGFPTETVYGLGADAFNELAVKKIFEIKERPLADPLILHVASVGQLDLIAESIPPVALKLIERFWPGPLTLIFKKTPLVNSILTAGLDTVAVRMPRNIIALALIKHSGTVIAAPSANKFQGLSPTTAEAVEESLGDKLELILDGGPSLIGLESTIVDISGDTPKILRWGGITKEELKAELGFDPEDAAAGDRAKTTDEFIPQVAPGMLSFHYAPSVPLSVYASLVEVEKQMLRPDRKAALTLPRVAWICFSSLEEKNLKALGIQTIFALSKDGSMEEAAKNYFETLRKLDGKQKGLKLRQFDQIYVLQLPNDGLGRAINERLRKAQHK